MTNESKAQSNGSLVDILGGEYRLRYSMYSLSQYKKLTGRNLMSEGIDNTDAEVLTAVVWAGLVDKQEEFDDYFNAGEPTDKIKRWIKKIGMELHGEKLNEVFSSVEKALLEAFPALKELQGAEEKNEVSS